MRYAVYKSLDKKNSLFGIIGSYQKYALYGLGASVFVGLLVGTSVNSLLGTVLGIVLAVVTYAAVLAVQSRYSEKERTKWFCSKKLPGYVLIAPRRLSRYVKFRISERYEVRRKDGSAPSDGVSLDGILEKMEEARGAAQAPSAAERQQTENSSV